MSSSKQRRTRSRRSPARDHDVRRAASHSAASTHPSWWTDGASAAVAMLETGPAALELAADEVHAWAREADFFALDLGFRCAHPRCPDCGADWCAELTVYGTECSDRGERSVWLSTRCSAYERDLATGRVPALHTFARAGMMRFASSVD